MGSPKHIDTNTLRTWLETGKAVPVPDIWHIQERTEWFIPGIIDSLKLIRGVEIMLTLMIGRPCRILKD